MNAQVSAEAIAAAAAVTEYVPLADLYLSTLNPRQDADAEGIALLAESLIACGLVQNLGGLRDEAGRVAIVFGGRRLRALQIAVETRPDLAMVPVKIAPDAMTAQAWASAENTARQDLNVVDEIRAYGAMAESGAAVANIAKAFAVTEAHVYRRLALANLPEPVLDALHEGSITLGIASCFTIANDEELALAVLGRVKGSSYYSEYQVKSMLQPEGMTSDDRRVRFVGLDAYREAGGAVKRDLFGKEEYIEDTGLMMRLFDAKLEAAAEALRAEGWKWVEVYAEAYVSYNVTDPMIRLRKEGGELSEDEAEEYDSLAELAEDDAMDEAQAARFEELTQKQAERYTPEQIAESGGWVYVSHQGALQTSLGYVRKEDAATAAEAGVIAAPEGGFVEAAPAEKSAYSAKLVEDMKAVRLAAAQTALLCKPGLVLDLLAFALSPEAGAYHSIMDIRTGAPTIVPSQDEGLALDERLTQRATTRCIDHAEAFAAFRAKGQKHRNAALTEAVARTLNYACGGCDSAPLFNSLEAEAGASIRSIWTPTVANFFGRVSAAYLDGLVAELLDRDETDTQFRVFRSLKKGAKAAELENLFSDPETQARWKVTPAQKARLDAWVPDCV